VQGNGIHWISAELAGLESTELTGLPGKRGIQTGVEPQSVRDATPMMGLSEKVRGS
jgi:hypothetical protein